MKRGFTKTFRLFRLTLCAGAFLLLSGFDFTVPVFNSFSTSNVTGTGFRLNVNVNLGDSRVYWVVTRSATKPSTAQIKAGDDETGANADDSGNIDIASGDENTNQNSGGSIGGLSSETQYYIHFYAEDTNATNDDSPVETLSVTTADVTNPSVTSAKVTDNTGTGFSFKVNVNDEGTVYYVVDNDTGTPTRTQVSNGQNASGSGADASGSVAVVAGVETTVTVTGLTFSPTKYNVYYFARDEAANESNVGARRIPVLNSSSIPSVTATQLTLRVNIDEKPVTVYYVVTTSSTKPTSAQILAGLDAANGTPTTSGNFSYNPGTVGTNVNQNITGLDDNTTYYVHFYGADPEANETIVETKSATTLDASPPAVVTLSPADNGTVDYNTDKLVLTFDENVSTVAGAATTNAHRVILYKAGSPDVAILTVARTAVVTSGATAEVTIPASTLEPNRNYYVLIGNDVIRDGSNNVWGGISSSTAWNFSTSGVTVNNVTSSICAGSFQSVADIVISEFAPGDFITSGSIFLDFANADFGYDASAVTVSAGPAGNTDITSVTLNPKTLTRLTLNYTLDGTNDKTDVITISGLKIYASAPGSTTIVNGNSIAGKWAADAPITFATINVGATTPAAPELQTAPAQDLLFCKNENISTGTVAVKNDGGTFTWYSNASLSTPLASGFQVNVSSDLGINTAATGIFKRYVVRLDGCQSAPLEVTFEIAPIPAADAGPATASVCSGTAITLGGSPTLVGPSVAGAYQYFWSTNSPAGFSNMGSNPSVTPVNNNDTTFQYTVRIVDANGCSSDITDPNATIAVSVSSTSEEIVYNSPLSTSFTLNSDPIELKATPSNSSTYSGNGVYLSEGKYYFDPDLAGTAGSPHAITYTTNLTNGCSKTAVRNFAVSSSSGSIVNLASNYCQNEPEDPSKVLSLGTDWSNYLAQDNAYYSQFGYTYEFYDFQTYMGSDVPGTGVVYPTPSGAYPDAQHIRPSVLQPYPYGSGTYAYVGMRVRKYNHAVYGPLGLLITPAYYEAPIFWNIQYVNIYPIPALKVAGVRSGDVVCDVDEIINLEANFETGTYAISRDGVNYVTGAAVGLIDNPVNSGKAIFNPHDAYVSTGFAAPNNNPASGITTFYIRYNYVVPNTTGSNNSACTSNLVIQFQISNNPTVAWDPFAQTEFCFEAPTATVSTNPRTGITLAGYGLFDNGNGTGLFDPDEALKAKAFATNSPPYTDYNTAEDIILSATRTDANGCNTTINQTVEVRPLFPASFTESDLDVCYEDGTQNIVGGQPNGNYVLSHPNLTVNFNQTTINNFNLRTYFDNAVANGADGSITQKFNLTFNTSDPALGCGNAITKTFSINPPIPMDIGGMTSGMIVCGNGTPFDLTGNQPSAGAFEISTAPNSGFVSNALGLNNTTSGKATYTPAGAGVPAGDPQKSLYIRYSFQGAGCVGFARTTEELIINPQPAISYSSSIPAPNSAYCFEQSATPTTLALATNQTTNITFGGFGTTDNGGGSATFNPTSAYQQSSLADNLNPQTDQTVRNIVVTARRTDALGCANTTTVSYIVNPLPTATFAPAKVEYCYEDNPETISGGQANVSFQYIYRNTTTPANYSPATIYASSTVFDPQVFFDDAVAKGANNLATLQFDVIYTAINSSTGCTNQRPPVTFTISPRIPVEIAGINHGDIFCSNVTDKELIFNPPNGSFSINGTPEGYTNGRYLFDPVISGPANGTNYTFTYTVITGNNCTNTQQKTVKVLPSPRAIFSVAPKCDTALIAFNAASSTNLSSASYTWALSDVTKTGQNVEHRFPGVSTYSVQLIVRHPAYQNDPSLVCADSLRLDQTVGPYPRDLDFKFFNVCEEDLTNFEVTSSIPISRVSWDFGDNISTGMGVLSNPVTGAANTSGTYQKPVHQYTGANDRLLIKVVGKTSDNFGGCETATERTISILKKWAPTPAEPSYDMSQINSGNGFWVVEDKKGNNTWEFSAPAKARIQANEMAWVTGAVLPYKADDASYVNSPCFDLSSFTRPVLSIKHWSDTEASDGAVLQYSIDGGKNWNRLGNVASGLEWYNRLIIATNPGDQPDLSSGWSFTNQLDWAQGKHTLDVIPGNRRQVRFRVAFSSFNNRESRDGFAFNNFLIEERNRTILIENFTNISETANNDAYKSFRTVNGNFNPSELVKIQYHHASADQAGAQPDQLHKDNPVDQNARAAFYGVTDPVRIFVDGGFGQDESKPNFTNANLLNTYFSLRSLVASPIEIAIDFDPVPSDKLEVKATVKATSPLKAGKYNVFIAVVERDIMGQAYVLRKFLPDPSGVQLTSLRRTDPAQVIETSYDMRHISRLPNGDFVPFAVIVFVQNLETKDVLQSFMRQDAVASPSIVTGVEWNPEALVRVYPNPADDLLNVILPAEVKEDTPVKLFDTFGKEVYNSLYKRGEKIKTIPAKTFSSGVYLVEVSGAGGTIRKKVMIVHE